MVGETNMQVVISSLSRTDCYLCALLLFSCSSIIIWLILHLLLPIDIRFVFLQTVMLYVVVLYCFNVSQIILHILGTYSASV